AIPSVQAIGKERLVMDAELHPMACACYEKVWPLTASPHPRRPLRRSCPRHSPYASSRSAANCGELEKRLSLFLNARWNPTDLPCPCPIPRERSNLNLSARLRMPR